MHPAAEHKSWPLNQVMYKHSYITVYWVHVSFIFYKMFMQIFENNQNLKFCENWNIYKTTICKIDYLMNVYVQTNSKKSVYLE